jgi:hypothetical protein
MGSYLELIVVLLGGGETWRWQQLLNPKHSVADQF